MKRLVFSCALFFIVWTAACWSNGGVQSDTAVTNLTNSQVVKSDEKKVGELRNQIEQIASAARGRVGVAAVILETGESVSFNPREHFPMQSVYKLPIGMTVLRDVDAGKIKLEEPLRIEKSDFLKGSRILPPEKYPNGAAVKIIELLQFMISESDNTASDVLLKRVGGAEAVMGYLSESGINEIVVANTEKEMSEDATAQYRNWASPDAAVNLLKFFYEGKGLSKENRDLLMKFLIDTQTGPKRLKGELPAGTVVAHKTGTSGTKEGITAATNDIGIMTMPDGRHLAIAVFVADSPADEATREAVIAKITRAIYNKLAQ